MLTYDDALQQVMATVQKLPADEIATAAAGGLVLADSVNALWDMPRANISAMDGYAISAASNTLDSSLEVIGASYAGHPFSGTIAKVHYLTPFRKPRSYPARV